MYVAFARELEGKKKHRGGPTSSQSVVQQQQQQRQPQQKPASVAPAPAPAPAEAAEDAESTSEHLRIQQYAILFRFNFWRRKTAPSSSDLRHRHYPSHVQQNYSYQVPQLRHLPQTLPVPPLAERPDSSSVTAACRRDTVGLPVDGVAG